MTTFFHIAIYTAISVCLLISFYFFAIMLCNNLPSGIVRDYAFKVAFFIDKLWR